MATKCSQYDFSEIESHWQKVWLQQKTFKAQTNPALPKYYVLDMFPYPSGAGLHIGHPEGYTASDILGRYKKACGFNVLHPMGWDAFGLPAEQHAVATGLHPSINTANNIENFRGQIQRLGFGIDWDREVNTTDPQYYRWTQWIFLQLFKHGLAYVDERPVWWCPALGTVLANEEVIDGKSERGNFPVEHRKLRQWVLKITAYADKLLEGLDELDWPDATKRQQKIWIGRSEGAFVRFDVCGTAKKLEVFTTRPDTLFGVSFIAVAPEYPQLEALIKEDCRADVENYCRQIAAKSDLERTDLAKGKSGVFTGTYVEHPFTHEKIPVWVADYVLMHHGTGAVMGVPAHDERDFEFANTYHLPMTPVVASDDEAPLPYTAKGKLINSGEFSGLTNEEATKRIIASLKASNQGDVTVQYKLHDWLFSRQRYWGEPFPIVWIHANDYQRIAEDLESPFQEFLPKQPVSYQENGETWCALPLTSKHLPLVLPNVSSYKPNGDKATPLHNAEPGWLNVRIQAETGAVEPDQGQEGIVGVRETNTMPQWAGSCWYYLRYLSPHADQALVDPNDLKYWGAPDLYIGGAEHAVLHLLYARFWHRFLYDIGSVSYKEPFPKLFHPGIILGTDGNKMSKSRGNVVNPDTIIQQYGADTLRLYEMFLGPLEASKPWSVQNIEGVFRFLKKVWREYVDSEGELTHKVLGEHDSDELQMLLHETIAKVSEAIEHLRFNTAISQLMICMNVFAKQAEVSKKTAQIFLQLLAPFAPHITEELWSRFGNEGSITEALWPQFDPQKVVKTTVKIMVQVNGKVRDEFTTDKDCDASKVIQMAKSCSKVLPYLEKGNCVKEIYVPNKIVNLVIR